MKPERIEEIATTRFDVTVHGDATYEMDNYGRHGSWMKAEHGDELIAALREALAENERLRERIADIRENFEMEFPFDANARNVCEMLKGLETPDEA